MEFSPEDRPLTRGRLAKRSGCNLETIRFYEKIGLLPPPRRSAGGHRQYDADDQRRLRFVMRARELDLGIEEIRSLLSLSDSKSYTCEDVHALAVGHLSSVREKIADLQRLERRLVEIADRCSGDTAPECPIIDVLWEDGEWTS